MSAQQRLISTLPASKTVLKESFIDGDELTAKILPGVEEPEDIDASNEAPKTRKRRRTGRERQAGKRLKARPSSDSLPTPWKESSFIKGPFKIRRKERFVREEKYKICFDASLQSINGIKSRMFRKGWDLKYATISNSEGLIVRVRIKVLSEFGHSFPCILEELEEILTNEAETDL